MINLRGPRNPARSSESRLRTIYVVEVTLEDQAVELEVLREFPSYLVCEDGVLVEPDGTLIEDFDIGEVLSSHIDTDLLPKRSPPEEESEEATSRFDRSLDWINLLVGKMPYGFWQSGIVPSGSPACGPEWTSTTPARRSTSQASGTPARA